MSQRPKKFFGKANRRIDEKALEEAESAIAEGRVISHQAICKWLGSWGKRNELPPPVCGA
jgi:predicted transcriptional regulator